MGNFDEFFPFDLGHGNASNTSRWRKMAQLWAPDGVLMGYTNQLNASAISGGQTTIATGACFIHGYYCEIATPQPITVLTSGTIVAKVDLVNQLASIYYKDGATDYSAYEQSANNWEIPLWLVSGGTTLTSLRTLISASSGLGWWAATLTGSGQFTSIATGTVIPTTMFTPRVPYAGQALLRGELLVTFTDASQAQGAICQLTYQFGSGDAASTPTITPTIAGGGTAGQPVAVPVSISGLIPVGQGRKTVAWRVTAGSGPQIQISSLTAQMTMIGTPAAA